jgi:hypothetical protein
MAHATGDLVNWLNADDVLWPGALGALADASRALPDDTPAVLVGGGARLDREGELLRTSLPHEVVRPVLPDSPPVGGGDQAAWFLTRSAWDLVGGVDPDLHFAMDIDLYHRCRRAGVPFVPVDAVLAAYREHPDNKTSAQWRRSIDEKARYHRDALSRLTDEERAVHGPRVDRYVTSLYLNSVRPTMPVTERARRVGRAVRLHPALLLRRNRVLRLWSVLRGQPSSPA